jgi:hypothetical protein
MNYCFGDIVVVDGKNIGVVVKSWLSNPEPTHEVYVRMYNEIKTYFEGEMERYMVRHKFLSEEELEYQSNAVNGL